MKYFVFAGIVFFVLLFVFLYINETIAGFCLLLSIAMFICPLIMLVIKIYLKLFKFCVQSKEQNNQNEASNIENLRPFLCSISKLRKKDGNVKRGDCAFAFDENLFIISQGDEKIENEIESIYYFDIWEYKDETYFKIRMRSATEYVFKSIRFEADKIAKHLKTKNIKIEDNRA